ncbi:hypothetical protein Dimus_012101 [Dionaea muscipula]
MKTASMCFSMFQVPRSRIYSLTNIWWERIDRSRRSIDGYTSRILASCACSPGDVPRKRWIRRPATPGSEGRTPNITPGISGEFVTSTNLNIAETVNTEFQQIQLTDLHWQSTEDKYLASQVTFLAFDIETTGFSRKNGRIVEIAIRDLRGGRDSIFQTLVNPECHVPNTDVHGITTCMVNRPEIPRMKDLIPSLIKYVDSRRKPGGLLVFIAHNGRIFDVPFLHWEFRRCSYEIPSNWLFLDTVPLAREAIKNENGGSKLSSKVSLQALREHYEIPMADRSHRAMSDVNLLALVFQRITFDLKLLTSAIVGRCFKASDMNLDPKTKTRRKASDSDIK